MDYELTEHARQVLEQREVQIEWLELTLNEPTLKMPDPDDRSLERWYRAIPEYGSRVLRVVVYLSVEPVRVVSVFFDRGMKGKL
jgi:uncharacterized protein DUF4258